MPSGLFKKENGRIVFAGPTPPSLQSYPGDQTKLLVRYIFQLTPEEQRRLAAQLPRSAAPAKKTSSNRVPHPAPGFGEGRVHGSNLGSAQSKQSSSSGADAGGSR